MASEIVVLTSDSEDGLEFCGILPVKTSTSTTHRASNSDEELMNLNLDSPSCHTKNTYDFTMLQKKTSPEKVLDNYWIETNTRNVCSTTENTRWPHVASTSIEPLSCTHPPKKKATKTKETKAYDKACKAAEAANKKSNRASDCLKNVTTLIDSRLIDTIPNSGNILTQLQQSEMKHSIILSPITNSVCWKREKINYHVAEDAMVHSTSKTVLEEDSLIVLFAEEFLILAQSSICDYVERVLQSLKKQTLTLIVFGLAAYWKGQSRKDKRRFRDRVSVSTETLNNSKKVNNPMNEDVGFTPNDLEIVKVKLALQTECSLWPVETAEELGMVIARITKAVAERPFKEERLEQTFDFYAADVSGNIKVSKDGHGLERLWQQQLMQFPLVALETSQAITSRYQSPQALMQAYKMCTNDKEASLLLQDIPIRRHAGPLSTSRKVGPELSKKIHKFLMCKDGFAIL